jgi:hypothetical protein
LTTQFHRGTALIALILCTCGNVGGQVPSNRKIDPAVVQLGSGFVSDHVQVNGTTLHFVRGGTGPAIILIHGFPQGWFEYHAIMPRLAKQFTVIAVDLRGVGGSKVTPGDYDAANMAEDVRQLVSALKLERVYWVASKAPETAFTVGSCHDIAKPNVGGDGPCDGWRCH